MKRKSGKDVREALTSMFENDFEGTPACIESDYGGEFSSKATHNFFKVNDIYYHRKRGETKAYKAEWTIRIVKRKLLALLRTKGTNDWVTWIKKVADNINHTVSSKHGFKPAEVANIESDVRVRDAMIARKKWVREDLHEAIKNSERYKKSNQQNQLYLGDIVQLNKWPHRGKDYRKAIWQV